MATTEPRPTETITEALRPIDELNEAWQTWPRGERHRALRAAAGEFRRRFAEAGQVQGVRTFPIASVPYPTKFAFGGVAIGPNPYVNIENRTIIVQFDDFEGQRRTLMWEPTIPEGSQQAPFYDQLARRFGTLGERIFVNYDYGIDEALRESGLRPEDVDYASFDHLHVQDPRRLLGTTEPTEDRTEPWEPALPNATFINQRSEVDTFRSPHPMQWPWYVPGGMDAVRTDRLAEIEGSVELGAGVAIVHTPGHTDGNQSLCINTPEGIWVSSENGVCLDNWQPDQSKIPGVASFAERYRQEVVLNSNTREDSIDQYDSMVLEKELADTNRRDPRWLNVFASSEMVDYKRQWPIVPTFQHGEMRYGEIVAPTSD